LNSLLRKHQYALGALVGVGALIWLVGTIQAETPVWVQAQAVTETATPQDAGAVPAPTETLAPYVHVIQTEDTLYYIIQQYGYTTLDVIPEIVQLNPNIPNADTLPGVGSEILIPRQTVTPTPAFTPQPTAGPDGASVDANAEAQNVDCYYVQEGDTLVGIAEMYRMTLEQLSQLNRDLNWFGCDFGNYSGGEDCNPTIQIGQCINVYMPTPTPTLTPTASGNETVTPTPTFAPPAAVYPPEGAIAPAGVFSLYWVGVGVLAENEYYLVEVFDVTGDSDMRLVTKQTSMPLPASMIPSDGQPHTINWQVNVAMPNADGIFRVISGVGPMRSFQWQSR
jgi:LysM repeat protein